MKSVDRGFVAGILLLCLIAAALTSGCGGGQQEQQPPISVSLSLTSITVQAGTTTQITAVVANDPANKGVNWTVTCSAAPCGSVSPTSTASGSPTTYTAPGAAPANTLTVTVKATSAADGSQFASATITVPGAASGALTVSVNPTSATVAPGATMQFTATVTNDPANAGVTWFVYCSIAQAGEQAPASCGTLSATATASGTATTYTAPSVGDLNVALRVTSVTNGNVTATANIRVHGIAILISPGSTTIEVGAVGQFIATVINDSSDQGVSWSLLYEQNGTLGPCPSASACGTVSPTTTASGAATTYAAPTTPPAGNQEITIVATSVANNAASAQAFIAIPGIAVSVAPSSATVEAGATARFTATVSNDPANKGVTWAVSCSTAPCGSVSPTTTASGVATTYSAPASAPSSDLAVSVTAASVTNSVASGSAAVTVPAITVSVTPVSALMPLDSNQQFTATVNNDPKNSGVSWTLTQDGTACSQACGTVAPANTASGSPTTYSAPTKLPANTAVTTVATSATDTTKSANSAVTITSGTVQIVPYSMDFGGVLEGQSSSPQITTLTNTGSTSLGVSSIAISGTNAGDYSQSNTCNASLGAGSSCTISVTFKPSGLGTRTADVSIVDSSTDSPQEVSLTGLGRTEHVEDTAAVRSALAGAGPIVVPAPAGPHIVGTRIIHLIDPMRLDPYLANGAKRELAIRLWYPAEMREECKTANYTSAAVWEYFAQLVNVKAFQVTTNSCLDAPISEGPHPVVVFTPGYTATLTDYTFLMEDLASRGYIVASVAHTYETTAIELSDGSLVKSILGSHLVGTWHGDEPTLSFVTHVRLQDLESVVNELNRLNSQAGGPFDSRLDMSRLAIAGHSVGGVTAFLAAKLDSRFKTVVMLDAAMPRAVVATTKLPVLLLAAGRDHWDDSERLLWNSLEGPRLAVSLTGCEHVAFSDWIWLAKDAVRTGPMGPEKTMSAVRDYVAAFLDANLRGEPASPLLNGPSSDYPDATVISDGELVFLSNTGANAALALAAK